MKTIKYEVKLERSVKIILGMLAVGIIFNAFSTPIAIELFGIKEALADFLWAKDILDLLQLTEKVSFTANEFLGLLKPLQHRAYSISSSVNKHPGSVHLTVAAVRWSYESRQHLGVCSTFLADRVAEGDKAGIFISTNSLQIMLKPQD